MKTVNEVKQYAKLHSQIMKKRADLIARLQEIDLALRLPNGSSPFRGGRAKNPNSLREVVLEVLKDKKMNKHDILNQVINKGYQFSTDDPLNSLGVILYGKKPKFKNERGLFSIA